VYKGAIRAAAPLYRAYYLFSFFLSSRAFVKKAWTHRVDDDGEREGGRKRREREREKRKISSHREEKNRWFLLTRPSFIIIFLRALLLILHGGGAAKSVSLSRSKTRDPPPVGRESAVFAEFIESLPFRVARAHHRAPLVPRSHAREEVGRGNFSSGNPPFRARRAIASSRKVSSGWTSRNNCHCLFDNSFR